MGLDIRPLGKPKPGFESKYSELFQKITNDDFGKQTKEEILNEWFGIQIQSYETLKAPRVGEDKDANDWIVKKYQETNKVVSLADFIKQHQGYYVLELSKEMDGIPVYISFNQDKNVFRGEFLKDCTDLIGEDLVAEAWETKLADETLDYGNRLMQIAEKISHENNMMYLKNQRSPVDEEESLESKLHILFSLSKWLIFYGKNGHG